MRLLCLLRKNTKPNSTTRVNNNSCAVLKAIFKPVLEYTTDSQPRRKAQTRLCQIVGLPSYRSLLRSKTQLHRSGQRLDVD